MGFPPSLPPAGPAYTTADVVLPWSFPGELTLIADADCPPLIVPVAGRIMAVRLLCGVAPTVTAIIATLTVNGVDIFGPGALFINPGNTDSGSWITPFLGSLTLTPGDVVRANITQVGAGVAGSNLCVNAWVEWPLF